jgi:hypothetical protein
VNREVEVYQGGGREIARPSAPGGVGNLQNHQLRVALQAAQERIEELEAALEDQQKISAELRRLIRPEDMVRCKGRQFASGEQCPRPAVLGEIYCRRHKAALAVGKRRMATTKAKRERAGFW